MARLDPYKTSPEGVAALVNVERYVERSGLDRKLVLLLNVRVSQMNGCAFCLHMHTQDALAAGELPERLYLLDAWRESAMFTARERAALDWAESLTNIAETHAPDAVFAELKLHFTQKEMADLSIAIAMINAWNRLAIGGRAQHPADVRRAA